MLQVRAQLLADQGQLVESIRDLDSALAIYKSTGDLHQQGRVLIGKGRVLGCFGMAEEAIVTLLEGLQRIDREYDPRLELVAKHNLVQHYLESGRENQALELLLEVRRLHSDLGNEVDLIRLRWIEGKARLECNELSEAETEFIEAKSYFIDSGMTLDAALVSLDLATVYLRQARITELKELAREMLAVFNALGIQREALAALAFFNKALEIEHVTALGALQECLEQARKNKDLRHHLTVSS